MEEAVIKRQREDECEKEGEKRETWCLSRSTMEARPLSHPPQTGVNESSKEFNSTSLG
jgi:hypothetical protein